MTINTSLFKYLLTCAIGFGLGGALWGWSLYQGIPETDYPLTILGAILLGIFGGLSLSIYSKNIKKILKSCGLGTLGCVIGFLIAFLGIYPLPNVGSFIVVLFPDSIIKFLYLPGLGITEYWLNFILAGIFIGLFFALALKIKVWSIIWRGAVGFGLGAIISPIFGNLLGNLFNLLLASYLITFSLSGIILGVFLGWGAYKSLKLKV